MKNTTVIAVIKSLSKKEQREFTKWLASPFFNQRSDVQQMFQYLIRGNHLEDDKFIEKERIYKKIFPKEPFNDDKIRQTIHFLYKQLEQYLAHKQLEGDRFAYPLAFLHAARKRKLIGAFEKKMNVLKKQQLGQPKLDSLGLRHNYSFFSEYSALQGTINRTSNFQLQDMISSIDMYFIAEKLRLACAAIAHMRVFKIQYEQNFLENILEMIEKEPALLDYPAIAVYYYGYLIQQQNDEREAHYFSFKKQITENITVFGEEEQRYLYTMALNFSIQQINKGAKPFIREAFEIYREVFSSKLVFDEGILSHRTYINAARIALSLGEYDWIEELVEVHTSYLEPDFQEPFSNFCKAKMAFDKAQYDDAMSLLVNFDSRDMLINFDARTTLMKIYFMQEEIDALDSLLSSMDIYLKRKEVIGYHKANYQNIVKLTRKLTRLNPYDKSKRQTLRVEIEGTSPLTEKPWLLEQLDKMG